MSHEERLKWMAGIKGGGTVSPMYMAALSHAAEQGRLTLRHSVQPRVIVPPPPLATKAMAGCSSGDSTPTSGTSVAGNEAPTAETTTEFRPIRVAFEPSAPFASRDGQAVAASDAAAGEDSSDGDDDDDDDEKKRDKKTPLVATGGLDGGGTSPPQVAEFDRVLLGTGATPDCRAFPLLRDLLDHCEAVPIVGGFPVLSTGARNNI